MTKPAYTEWSPEAAAEAQDADEAAKASEWMKFRDGVTTRVRVFPPVHAHPQPFADTWEHAYKVGQRFIRHNCPARMGGKVAKRRCETCVEVEELYATRDATDEKQAGEMRAKRSCVWQGVNVDKPEVGIQYISAPPRKGAGGLHEQFLDLMTREKLNFVSPENGIILEITRQGERTDTVYKVVAPRSAKPFPLSMLMDGDLTTDDWLSAAFDLGKRLIVPTDEEIAAIRAPRNDAPARGRLPARRGERTAQDALRE